MPCDFLNTAHQKKSKLNPSSTLLMDETAVLFEDPRRDTVDFTGARHVVLRSTGFASMRITIALTVTDMRTKLSPLLIWKGAKKPIEKSGADYVAYQERVWMNSELLIKWIDLMFPALLNFCDVNGIVWDSMRAYIAKDVKAKCISKKIDMMVIPGGLTPYLQKGDIEIFKSFKDCLSSVIDDWKRSDRFSTPRTEIRGPRAWRRWWLRSQIYGKLSPTMVSATQLPHLGSL